MKGEFEFIHSLKLKYSFGYIGDDCAVLPKDERTDVVITTDMLVEDIDFRLDWTTPEFLGHKSLAVSLSDIAAMGADPKWAMLSIGIPDTLWKTGFLDRFYAGLHTLAKKHSVEVVGGDISRVPDKLVINSTVLGEVARGQAVLRSGAAPGDAVFVTGFLGGAAAGLRVLESGVRFGRDLSAPTRHLLFRQLQPLPHIHTGKVLQKYDLPNAMLDISDGLSSDLHHLLSASNVGARIQTNKIPVDPAINAICEIAGDAVDLALHGGEDFELLFTVDREKISFALDLGFHHIGEVTANVGIIELTQDGESKNLKAMGYQHF